MVNKIVSTKKVASKKSNQSTSANSVWIVERNGTPFRMETTRQAARDYRDFRTDDGAVYRVSKFIRQD